MNAHVRQNGNDLLSPARVADYIHRIEARLGRRIEAATIMPDGGIEVRMADGDQPSNPADLVDMTE